MLKLTVKSLYFLSVLLIILFSDCHAEIGIENSALKRERRDDGPLKQSSPADNESSARKARYLCSEKGCRCNSDDQNLVTEVECDCLGINDNASGETALTFSERIRFPPSLKKMKIFSCDFVEFEKRPETYNLNLSDVFIHSVKSVTIEPSSFRRVANLTIKDVVVFNFPIDRSFDNLEADSITFRNVTHFGSDSTGHYPIHLRPVKINSKLEFISSTLSNALEIELMQDNVTGLTISFRNCTIHEIPFSVIRGDHIEFLSNSFLKEKCISSPARNCENPNVDGKPTVSLQFIQSLRMMGNTLNNQRMPDVQLRQLETNEITVVYPDQKIAVSENGLEDFEFKGIVIDKSRRNKENCTEKPVWDSKPPEIKVICPNQQALMDYIRMNKLKTVYDRHPNPFKSSSSLLSLSLMCISLTSFTFLSFR